MIEGARNVGKTHLINSLTAKIPTYKFPFAKFYNECFVQNYNDTPENINSKKELFYLTLGYDITILDLAKQGLLKENIIVDRGILTNLVFGIQSGRITEKEAKIAWEYLLFEYSGFFEVVYIKSDNKEDTRNKDMWSLYNKEETEKLYRIFLTDMKISDLDPIIIKNNFDDDSIKNFNASINMINN